MHIDKSSFESVRTAEPEQASRVRRCPSPPSRPTWYFLSLKNLILESVLVGLLLNH